MSSSSWWIGVALASGAALVSNAGLNLQKLVHLRRAQGKTSSITTLTEPEYVDDDDDVPLDEETAILDGPDIDGVEMRPSLSRTLLGRSTPHRRTHFFDPHGPRSYAAREFGRLPIHEDQEEESYDTIPYACQPLWLLGIGLVILGALCDFVALAFAPALIIAPLGSLTLVFNLYFAPLISEESVTRRDVTATVLIVMGAAVAVAFASHKDPATDFDELFGYFKSTRYFFYISFISLLVLSLWRLIFRIEELILNPSESSDESSFTAQLSGTDFGKRFLLKCTRFGYATIAGISGAQSVIFAKCVSVALREYGIHTLTHAGSFAILSGMLATIFLQIRWLNMGLQIYSALYVVPVFQASWISFSVLGGLVVFQEAETMEPFELGLFMLGIAICVEGVTKLSERAGDDHEDELDFMTRSIENLQAVRKPTASRPTSFNNDDMRDAEQIIDDSGI